MPASNLAGAGMRRHVHSRHHAAESFVSFIPLFDDVYTLYADFDRSYSRGERMLMVARRRPASNHSYASGPTQ